MRGLEKPKFELKSFMNSPHFQSFKSSDLVGLLLLSALCVLIVAGIVSQALESQKKIEAYKGAEKISLQLMAGELSELDLQSAGANAKRSPASEKTNLGLDPWGYAYQYKIFHSPQASFLVVWSTGPNGSGNTDLASFHVDEKGLMRAAEFGGDDVGYIQQIRR